MTRRGEHTRSRLVKATQALVAEDGYHAATTRAIADRAGVSEATIYRHFPDKRALFVTALVEGNTQLMTWLEDFPDRAGTSSVEANLVECLLHLSTLRAAMAPMERALGGATLDPDSAPPGTGELDLEAIGGPPAQLARYLSLEREQGRVRADVDPVATAIVMLAMLSGLAMGPAPLADRTPELIAQGVRLIVLGID